MTNERSRKTDRYHPAFFAFFRNVVIRSKSLDYLYDQNQAAGTDTKAFLDINQMKMCPSVNIRARRTPTFDISQRFSEKENVSIIVTRLC